MSLPNWLSRSLGAVKTVQRVEPRRTAFVAACFSGALVLVAVGAFGVTDRQTNNSQMAMNEQVAAGTGVGPRSPASGMTPTTEDPTATPATTEPGAEPTTTSAPEEGENATPGAAPVNGDRTSAGAGGGWVSVSGTGLRLSVTAARQMVSAGDTVRFSAKVEDSSGGITALLWDFGDGNRSTSDVGSCSDPANRPTVTSGRTSFTASTTHTFRNPGDFSVSVQARTGARCGSNATPDAVTATGSVRVVGETLANGPSQPTAGVSIRTGGMPNDPLLGLTVRAADTDGYISSVIVNWDDGSAPKVYEYPLSSCVVQANGLPSTSRVEVPERSFLRAKSYDITVTVTSVGCNGTQAQQAIGVLNGVTVGGTTPGDSSATPLNRLF